MAPLEVAGSSTVGITVMRTHARIRIRSWSTTVADKANYGFMIGRTDDVGVTNDLAANTELDWMLYDELWAEWDSGALVAGVSTNRVVDLKSKRRMGELNQRYLFCAHDFTAAAGTSWDLFARTLIYLA